MWDLDYALAEEIGDPELFVGRKEEESYDSLLARINKAHAEGLDSEESALLRGMRGKYRKTLKEPW